MLSSERKQYVLRGRAAATLAPLLDGRTTQEIIAALAGTWEAAEIVSTLERWAGDELVGEFCEMAQPEAAYWELLGTNTQAVTHAKRHASADVVSWHGAGTEGLEQALKILGVVIQPGASFQIISVSDYLDPQLRGVARQAWQNGRPWMLVRPYGRRQWIGPLFIPGRTACMDCVAQALWENGWQAGAAIANLPTTSAVTATMAATEVAKWLFTGSNREVEGQIREIDTGGLAIHTHRVVRRPNCRVCGSDATGQGEGTLISRLTGLVQGVDTVSSEPGFHVCQARGSRIVWPDEAGVWRRGEGIVAMGHGASAAAAEKRCLWEAMERYSVRFQGSEAIERRRFADIAEDAIHPNRLTLYSEAQYAAREQWNRQHGRQHRVGEPFDPNEETGWTPAVSLVSGRRVLVPAAYCYLGYGGRFCGANTNGCAAGEVVEDAAVRGLIELIERDAAALWWYTMAPRPAVPLESIASERVTALARLLERGTREVHWLDLTTDFGVPVCAAASTLADGSALAIGTGAGSTMEVAAWRATAEMYHKVLVGTTTNARLPGFTAVIRAPGVAHLDLPALVARAKELGLDVLMLNLTRAEIGTPVVRMIVPGMRAWWASFAPGRIYDVPAQLGWIPRKLTEEELNPVPFPL